MAKITNRFVHFKTKASFTSRLGAGDIQESSVVFIQDANEIWTHGTYYKCDISEAEVIALINSKGYITEADIPSLTGGASATSGQYVSGVTVSGHNVTVTKAALPTNAETATKLATPRVIAIAGAISGSTTFDGSSNVSINSTLNSFDASKITSGTLNADRLPEIPISKIPAAAMERLYVVESQSAAMSLTIQEGDVVQIGSGGPMYFCVSESAPTFATKFKVFTAGAATSVPWSGVTNAPTKLSQFTNDSGFTTNKGTVTSVAMSVPTGLSISGSPITASGTLALSYTSGYSIPTTAKQTNWDTAYGWGNHASAGYAKTTQLNSYLPLSGGTLSGKLSTAVQEGKWILGKDSAAIQYKGMKAASEGNYNSFLGIKTNTGNTVSYGVLNDNCGFYTYLSERSTNGYDYSFSVETSTGIWNFAHPTSNEFVRINDAIIATRDWVTGKGYLTSVPAQTWVSITGKPTTLAGYGITDAIKNTVAVSASTLAAGSSATASYDASTNKFTFGIPRGATGAQGPKGDKGDKGDTGATGPAGTYTAGSGISISGNTIEAAEIDGSAITTGTIDYERIASREFNTQLALYAKKAGDTFTGPIILAKPSNKINLTDGGTGWAVGTTLTANKNIGLMTVNETTTDRKAGIYWYNHYTDNNNSDNGEITIIPSAHTADDSWSNQNKGFRIYNGVCKINGKTLSTELVPSMLTSTIIDAGNSYSFSPPNKQIFRLRNFSANNSTAILYSMAHYDHTFAVYSASPVGASTPIYEQQLGSYSAESIIKYTITYHPYAKSTGAFFIEKTVLNP